MAELQNGWEKAYQEQGQDLLWQEDPIPVLAPAVKRLTEAGARTVVDFGCGDGRNMEALIAEGFTCLGVDIAPTGLRNARATVRNKGFLLQADASATPLVDASVDAVTCFDVFGQIMEPQSLLDEAKRLLTPDGTLVVNAFTFDDSEYGIGEEIAPHTFAYKDTLFRFFDEKTLREVFDGWEISEIDRISWQDPPHGEFRPYWHTHDNWIVYASPGR